MFLYRNALDVVLDMHIYIYFNLNVAQGCSSSINAERVWICSLLRRTKMLFPFSDQTNLIAMGMAKQTLIRGRRGPCWSLSAISSAFSEWWFKFLSFINVVLSYIVMKFFCYCKLPTPCLLCTSFDALVGKENRGLFRESICDAHKLEVSSLSFCRVHKRLDDVDEMCDGCLGLSEDGTDLDEVPLLKHCTCCSVPFRKRSLVSRLVHSKRPIESEFSSCGSKLKDGLGMVICDDKSEVPFSDGNGKLKEQFTCPSPVASKRDFQARDGTGNGPEEMNLNQSEARSRPPTSSGMTSEPVPSGSSNTKLDDPAFGGADHGKANQLIHERPTTGNKSFSPSPATTEIISGRESSRVNGQGDESRLSDASSSAGFLKYVKDCAFERCDSGLESSDGSLISEVEGESEVERLKRQIRMDRKSMSILYRDLEDERNASTIAANQAMAMINRLQEEKAAMQIDGFQYLRMMEEQTEYDHEALQKLNDLLADRDQELQDLEGEFDSYVHQYEGEPPYDGEPPTERILESLSDLEEREYRSVSSQRFVRSGDHETGSILVKNIVPDFEDEKVDILACLRRLEKRLQLFSNNGIYVGGSVISGLDDEEDSLPDKSSLLKNNATISDGYLVKKVDKNYQGCPRMDNVTLEKSRSRGTMSQDSFSSSEDLCLKASSTRSSFRGVQYSITEALKKSGLRSLSYNERQIQMLRRRHDIFALGNEISKLNSRLEALESDGSFLEHAVNSLRNGSSGLEFIQEIACHLRELRKIGTTC